MKSKPYSGNLRTINNTMRMWINVVEGSNLTVAGLAPERTLMVLRSGWSLVGFPSFRSGFTFTDLKSETNANGVEAYGHLSPPNYLKEPRESDFLSIGNDHWILTPENVT